jgi:hypothetical protein
MFDAVSACLARRKSNSLASRAALQKRFGCLFEAYGFR